MVEMHKQCSRFMNLFYKHTKTTFGSIKFVKKTNTYRWLRKNNKHLICLDFVCTMLAEKVQFSDSFFQVNLCFWKSLQYSTEYVGISIGIMQQKILLIIWQIWIIYSIFNWNISVNDEWCLCQQWFCLLNELFLIEY